MTDNPDDVRASAAAQMGFYDAVPSYARVIAEEGADHAADLALIGDEETVAAGLHRYRDAGATEIVLAQTDLGGPEARLERHGPLVAGAGFSGHGFKHAPAVGEALAALATDRVPATAHG